jgi:hypothetical protein
MLAGRRATGRSATPQIHQRSRRSSPSCGLLATACTAAAARVDRRALARGLRIHEALALAEADLDARRGSLLVRRG